MIITIDGPVASGKSTVTYNLAKKLEYIYLNSGLLYRALGYICIRFQNKPIRSLPDLSYNEIRDIINKGCLTYYYNSISYQITVTYQKQDIALYLKDASVDKWASLIALNANARQAILEYQRLYAKNHNIVIEGRDAGSIVFPFADYKFYLTAKLSVRAYRWKKAQEKYGYLITQEQAENIIGERDIRDKTRSLAPLMVPKSACVIDNSDLTLKETIKLFLNKIIKKEPA